ncbi:hypothetical protein MAPG_06241 [Magnaporthiopsis poae ATCC 64411]|uniref:Ankyrin repeat protein n=1 Tax=Magnaporthiopsis poae (strain ATCC 64411 / 73-15) TaxID=644358 RepID=A0A0C4E1I0_MAGP6|nr:hypothetical protein MAPG_06241 [Magnaporthiopsis poae ATCC 64411]
MPESCRTPAPAAARARPPKLDLSFMSSMPRSCNNTAARSPPPLITSSKDIEAAFTKTGLCLQARLGDCFLSVIEQLVVDIGFRKAVRLRLVSRPFDTAIMRALCHGQVVHYDDMAARTRTLDLLIDPSGVSDDDARRHRHLLVAEAVVIKFPEVLINRSRGCEQFEWYCHSGSASMGDGFLRGTERGNEAADILCGAIVLGDLGLVRSLLEKGEAQVNEEAPHFGRPLQVAAAWGHADIVQHLLDHGADARATHCDVDAEPRDWTEWREYDNYASAQCQRGYVNKPTFQSREVAFSALFAAMLGGHEAIVRCLMREEHRLPATSQEYYRAIMAGARIGKLDLIQLLIRESGLSLMEHHSDLAYMMMLEACEHGQFGVIEYLLANGMWIRPRRQWDTITQEPVSTRGWTDFPLGVAASRGNERLVRYAVDRGQIQTGLRPAALRTAQ